MTSLELATRVRSLHVACQSDTFGFLRADATPHTRWILDKVRREVAALHELTKLPPLPIGEEKEVDDAT